MMKTVLAAAVLSLQAASNDPKFEEFKKEAFRKEAEGAWKKIEWRKDAAEAIEKSGGGKPLLVVIVVGHMAKKGAKDC